MIPDKDPHFRLGLEHAHTNTPRCTDWSDPELQKRYDAGFFAGPTTWESLNPPPPSPLRLDSAALSDLLTHLRATYDRKYGHS